MRSIGKIIALTVFALSATPAIAQAETDEPDLPAGLENESESEPGLPEGLGDDSEPGLPAGLEDASEPASGSARPPNEGFSLPFEWNAFIDLRGGLRLRDDDTQKRASLGELRLQLHGQRSWTPLATTVSVTVDTIYDPVIDVYEPDLETGDGVVDIRETSLALSPTGWMDLKLGRQILTWGTGDLLFINDLFPKDWNAFLTGRDLSYLKAPSDAAKVSIFHSLANLDLIYVPRFDADRYPNRRRLSSWDPLQQRIVGRQDPLAVDTPDSVFDDDEWHARVHRRLGRYELAAYGYRGFWKSPGGFAPTTGQAIFPKLSVYGASLRRALLGGIAHLEGGYYDSADDRDGDNAFVRNSEIRGLIGFEREVISDLTVGAQYYVEYMRSHDAFERSQPPGTALADRARHLTTLRVTYLALGQNLRLSLFGYYSPSDEDAFVMPAASYAVSDVWKLSGGANLFFGKHPHTFFGQLEDNTNFYGAIRASW